MTKLVIYHRIDERKPWCWALYQIHKNVKQKRASGAFWAHNPECGLLGKTSPIPFDHMIDHVAARFLRKRLTEKDEIECLNQVVWEKSGSIDSRKKTSQNCKKGWNLWQHRSSSVSIVFLDLFFPLLLPSSRRTMSGVSKMIPILLSI